MVDTENKVTYVQKLSLPDSAIPIYPMPYLEETASEYLGRIDNEVNLRVDQLALLTTLSFFISLHTAIDSIQDRNELINQFSYFEKVKVLNGTNGTDEVFILNPQQFMEELTELRIHRLAITNAGETIASIELAMKKSQVYMSFIGKLVGRVFGGNVLEFFTDASLRGFSDKPKFDPHKRLADNMRDFTYNPSTLKLSTLQEILDDIETVLPSYFIDPGVFDHLISIHKIE